MLPANVFLSNIKRIKVAFPDHNIRNRERHQLGWSTIYSHLPIDPNINHQFGQHPAMVNGSWHTLNTEQI